jgi:hypothetical protein
VHAFEGDVPVGLRFEIWVIKAGLPVCGFHYCMFVGNSRGLRPLYINWHIGQTINYS